MSRGALGPIVVVAAFAAGGVAQSACQEPAPQAPSSSSSSSSSPSATAAIDASASATPAVGAATAAATVSSEAPPPEAPKKPRRVALALVSVRALSAPVPSSRSSAGQTPAPPYVDVGFSLRSNRSTPDGLLDDQTIASMFGPASDCLVTTLQQTPTLAPKTFDVTVSAPGGEGDSTVTFSPAISPASLQTCLADSLRKVLGGDPRPTSRTFPLRINLPK